MKTIQRSSWLWMLAVAILGIIGHGELHAELPSLYRKVLSWHLPSWIIDWMDQPEVAMAIIGAGAAALILLFIWLGIKLWLTARRLRKLRDEHHELQRRYDQLHHQVTMINFSSRQRPAYARTSTAPHRPREMARPPREHGTRDQR